MLKLRERRQRARAQRCENKPTPTDSVLRCNSAQLLRWSVQEVLNCSFERRRLLPPRAASTPLVARLRRRAQRVESRTHARQAAGHEGARSGLLALQASTLAAIRRKICGGRQRIHDLGVGAAQKRGHAAGGNRRKSAGQTLRAEQQLLSARVQGGRRLATRGQRQHSRRRRGAEDERMPRPARRQHCPP